jgi:uncharacterized membrane protein YphA (DoxX/SURF4 family)
MIPTGTAGKIFLLVGRISFGLYFIYAGCSKIFALGVHPRPSIRIALLFFATQLDTYQALCPSCVQFVAHTLPFAEVALGLLLLIGWRLEIWSAVLTLFMAVFLISVTRAYLLHLEIECGCTAGREPLTIWKVMKDAALLVCCILLTLIAVQQTRQRNFGLRAGTVQP